MTAKTRNVFSLAFKLNVVEYYTSLPEGVMDRVTETAQKFGVGTSSVKRWFTQYSRGELNMENAIAVSRRPSKVITGDTYHLAGKDFKSKEEAIRYAVELAGGLTVSKMTTVSVEV
nr:MAG TPA: SiR5 protein [Caudoviricetes sp.]